MEERKALGVSVGTCLRAARRRLAAPLRLGRGAESLEDEYRWPENRLLTKTVLDFQGKFQRNEVGLTIEVMDFLKNWLGKHILVVDKRYGPFFNDKGMR